MIDGLKMSRKANCHPEKPYKAKGFCASCYYGENSMAGSKITKPMLAGSVKDLADLKFPVLCTPKLDGIRCLKINGKALSRKFKEIPNHHVRKLLETLPDGLDGELMLVGGTFNETQSAIMTEEGEPNFQYAVFDYVSENLEVPYITRAEQLDNLKLPKFCVKILPEFVFNIEALEKLELQYLEENYEGVMIRSSESPYKCGRSSLKQGYLLKYKQMEDSEAVILGFEEKMHNNNVAEKDAFGRTKRSSHKANLVPAHTLGCLLVKDIKTGVEFSIGTGFDDEMKQEIWDGREKYLGKLVTYTHQPSGAKDKPRFPSFKGFRDERDL
jgi:DNA ligase-1